MDVTGFLYWDASAILSLLVEDIHTPRARAALTPRWSHFVSSLGVAEVLGVLAHGPMPVIRTKRAQFLRDVHEGFWLQSHLVPPTESLDTLSEKHPLRGADLWHLAAALALKKELPNLRLITFDLQLARATRREGMLFAG